MHIGLISLQTERTPPPGYGAVGRIVSELALGLYVRGIEVLPIVAEGSTLDMPKLTVPFVGHRRSPDPESFRDYVDALMGCDIVHNHDPNMTHWLEETLSVPVITTLHVKGFPRSASSSRFGYISAYQASVLGRRGFSGWTPPIVRRDLGQVRTATVSDSFLMLGQVRPEKGIIDGCRLSRMAGRNLTLAGPLPRRCEQAERKFKPDGYRRVD
jgi:hypothetical protein